MVNGVTRREVLSGLAVLGLTASEVSRVVSAQAAATPPDLMWPQPVTGISQAYPTTDAIVARDIVGASHNSLDRVKAMVSRQPELAKASWDWGFGDWETALGAASHVGNRPIADVEVFDPQRGGVWQRVASLRKARNSFAAATGPDGRIYVIGGFEPPFSAINSVEVYGP